MFKFLTHRNSLIFLVVLFFILGIWIASHPYNVMTMDIADATTNYIWVHLYAHGVFSVPYSQWTYGITQSVVVFHNGQYVVVNEKGPGFGILLVPFYITGTTWLFGPVMVAIAVASTYMLALRITDWKVAFFAAFIVMLNLSVLAMWSHYYWTDAATMHLLVLSIWLLVESNYWYNGRNLIPTVQTNTGERKVIRALLLSVLSGLVFGIAVSTRYPVALILPALLLYIIVFFLIRALPYFKSKEYRKALSKLTGIFLLIPFLIGLAIVLIPLIQYNIAYFGSPFSSGYDATTIMSFSHSQSLAPRNQSTHWFDAIYSDLWYAGRNFIDLLPILVFRMPALLLLPFGIWILRKDKPSLVLFSVWIFIAMYTYLSISWVVKYDTPKIYLQTVWEPRYFMPAIPPTAILGGMVLRRLTLGKQNLWNYTKGESGIEGKPRSDFRQNPIPALVFLIIVAALGIIPMILFFSHNGGVILAPNTHLHNVSTRPPLNIITIFSKLRFWSATVC